MDSSREALTTHTRARSDGRREVADSAGANATYGCRGDSECILADGHDGEHCHDREVWATSYGA